jgi:hypothetical protein
MSNYCVIRESALGRWYLANAGDESLAWSGMRWVPHVQGIPADRVHICNFGTMKEAIQYTKAHGLTVILKPIA